ncbi:erythromycin esterase family protein [Spirosoma pomorum]
MRFLNSVLFTALYFLFLSVPAIAQPIRSEQQKWQQAFTPFHYQQLTDTAQFDPVSELVRGKSIVAVGEVTHGTKQVNQLQVKVAMDLCRHDDFRIVVLGETYTASTLALNRYVLFDEGTLDEALQDMADHQGVVVEETRELAKWVHDENRARPFDRRIWLVGAEVAPPGLLADVLLRQGSAHWPTPLTDKLSTIARTPAHLTALNFGPAPDQFIRQTFAQALSLLQPGTNQAESLEQQWQRQLVSQYQYASDIFIRHRDPERELGIFENIKWLREHLPDRKLVIIDAHNGHVQRHHCYHRDYFVYQRIKRFGHFLHEVYPDDYFVIGTEVQRGYFNRGFGKEINRIPEHPKKIGTILGGVTDSQYGLLPMNKCRSLGLFQRNDYRLSFGTSDQVKGQVALCNNIADAFDALIFIRESEPAVLLDSLASKPIFSVYLNVAQPVIDSVTASRRMAVNLTDIQFAPSSSRPSSLNLQVYIHTKRKRFLKLANFRLQPGDSASIILPDMPKSAKLISMMLVGKNIEQCRVGKLAINGHTVAGPEFLLVEPSLHQLTAATRGGFAVSSR